jgi:NADH:ubiquinone oxidoreductase subunit 5 (subunit L)/multisubunit Na+/H+ antiporter MnhA subunit
MNSTLERPVAVAAAASCLLALAGLVQVIAAGPVELPGLVLDRLTAVLVVLICALSAVVAIFSTRYLQDDRRLGRFLGRLALTTAGTVVFAAGSSLLVLVAGWLVAGAGFCLMLAHVRHAAGGRTALRRTAVAFAAGDVALVGAAAVALVAVGNLDLRDPAAAASALAAAGVAGPVGVLVVVAALARCAQIPLHRWLPATVAAPTPVCALLHAGVVNAGGILLIRLGPATGLPGVAAYGLFAAGAATAAYGAAVMLSRADVKGALAHSTMAQMGFMLVQVALGAVAAAVVHLIGHAMYKAALFLGSGSAIGAGRRRAAAPAGRGLPVAARAAASMGLPLAALAAAVALAGGIDAVGGQATAVLLAFAWAGGAHAVDGWLRSGPPRALLAAAAGAAVAAAAYVGLLAGAKAFLAPSLPAMGGVDPWLAVALVPAVVAATAARILAPAAGAAAAGAAGATAYAWLLDAGAVDRAARPARRRRAPRRRPVVRVGRPAEVLS